MRSRTFALVEQSDTAQNEPNTEAVIQAATRLSAEMLSRRKDFQKRARRWITTPDFTAVYEDLHPAVPFSGFLSLFRSDKSVVPRSKKVWSAYDLLATNGELSFASLIVDNAEPTDDRKDQDDNVWHFPVTALVTGVQDPLSLVKGAVLAHELSEALQTGEAGLLPESQKLLRGSSFQPLRRRALPSAETEGVEAALLDVRIAHEDLFQGDDDYPFVPVLVSPNGAPFIVVPWAVVLALPAQAFQSQRPATSQQDPYFIPPLPPRRSRG